MTGLGSVVDNKSCQEVIDAIFRQIKISYVKSFTFQPSLGQRRACSRPVQTAEQEGSTKREALHGDFGPKNIVETFPSLFLG